MNKIDLESWNPEDESEYALGLFSKSHLKYVDERNNKTTPDLELMITKALKKLKKNENGFFLMVEGGKLIRHIMKVGLIEHLKRHLN